MAVKSTIRVLESAARTATVTGLDMSSELNRGHFLVVVSVAGTGSITPKIQGKSAFGDYYDILEGTAITTTGTNVLKIGPGFTPSANAVATDCLPKTFRVVVTHNNANSITYSVGAELMA